MPDEPIKPQFTPPATFTPKLVQVEQPKEPPKEVLERKFEIDPSLINGGEKQTVTIDDKAVVKPEEKKDDKVLEEHSEVDKGEREKASEVKTKEVSSILKPPAGEKGKEETQSGKKLITVPGPKVERDYSLFPAEDIPVLKQMSNDAFAHVEKLYKEKKELQSKQDNIFLQHPDGFTLSPEHGRLTQQISLARTEANYWRQCLVKIDKGEPIKNLGMENNQLVMIGPDIAPSKDIEESVRMNLNRCTQFAEQQQGVLQEKKAGFTKQLSTDNQMIQAEREARFDWVKNPKLMDYTLEINGKEMSIKDIRQEIISLFPPYSRNQIATEVCADMFVALRIQDAELQQARAGKTVAEEKQKEIQRAEPGSSLKPQEKKEIGGVKTFSLAEMPS